MKKQKKQIKTKKKQNKINEKQRKNNDKTKKDKDKLRKAKKNVFCLSFAYIWFEPRPGPDLAPTYSFSLV